MAKEIIFNCSSFLLFFDVALRTQDIYNMSLNFKLQMEGLDKYV